MAEAFGVAAGVISVASLAIQIGDSLRIAIDFWEAVQHGPENLDRICTQLQVLYEYIAEIRREHQNGQIHGIQEELFKSTLVMMKRDLDKLTDLVSDLAQGIAPSQDSWNRKIGRVQMAMKEGAIKRAKEYVESATYLLHFLQSWRSHTMLQQIDGKIDVLLANYIRDQKQYRRRRKTLPLSLMPTEHVVSAAEGLPRFCIHDEPSNTSQQLLTRLANTSHINVFGFMHGSIITTTTGQSNSLEGDKDAELYSSTKLTFQVLFKLSFYTRGLRFQTNDSLNSWCLNSIRCISNDSPIFTLCQNGNAQGMLRLFRARKASIYDVDEQGWSLLHHACWSAKPDICRLLVDLGADIYQLDDRGCIPTSMIGSPDTFNCLDHEETVNLMIKYAEVDPFSIYWMRDPMAFSWPFPTHLMSHSTLASLLSSDCFYGTLNQRVSLITTTLRDICQLNSDYSKIIRLLCTRYEAIRNLDNEYTNLDPILLDDIIGEWCWNEVNDEQSKESEQKIEQILRLTKDLHRINYRGQTPLERILAYASNGKTQTITLITKWLVLVAKSGIDYREYVRQELKRHPDGYMAHTCCRSIKLTVILEDAENGLHVDVENIRCSRYGSLDPVFLCEAWRSRSRRLGSVSTCLSLVDEGLIFDGRPLPNAPGSWEATIKPNSELALKNKKWIDWQYEKLSPTGTNWAPGPEFG